MLIIWLKRILKYTLILLLIFILAIVSWVGYYYFKEIRPYKPIIENILANADSENRHPPENVVKMIEAEFYCPYERDIFGYALKCGMTKNQMIVRLVVGRNDRHEGMFDWHAHQFGVSWMLGSSFTENELNGVYAQFIDTGYHKKGKLVNGLNAYSLFKYKKPLSELSLKESAELIGILKAPSMYKRNPEKLAERTNILLKKYEAMTGIKN